MESKTFEIEAEEKKGKMQVIIVERKRGVSSWIKMGPDSLGLFVESLALCIKDTRIGKWVRNWRERGRIYSMLCDKNKGECFIRLGVEDLEKKRFNIFIPKGRGGKGGQVAMVETLRALGVATERKESQEDEAMPLVPSLGKSFAEVVKLQNRNGRLVARVEVSHTDLSRNLKRLDHCLVSLWDPKSVKGDDLRSWGNQMARSWGLKGNLGLAKLERGKVLLEFEMAVEAEKALNLGGILIGKTFMRLEKWSPRTGCLLEGEKKNEAWVRIMGLPISLWDWDTLRKVGEKCGGFLVIDS